MWNLRRQVNGGTVATQRVDDRHAGRRPRRPARLHRGPGRRAAAASRTSQEACDLPKSTTSRLLTALERSDLLERTDDGSYVAGGLFWLLRRAARPGRGPGPAGRPDAGGGRRGARTRPSTSAWPAASGSCRSPRSTRSFLLGTRDWTQVDVPAHCSSLGKVFLAFGAPSSCRRARCETPTAASHHRPRRAARRLRSAPATAAGPPPSTSSRSGSPASPPPSGARRRPGGRRPGRLGTHAPTRGPVRRAGPAA